MSMQAYLSRLQQLPDPSIELQSYIQRLSVYIQAGGVSMETSDEVWLGFIAQNQDAWDAMGNADQGRARECAAGLT